MYTVSRYEAQISVSEYLKDYVDIPTFHEACTRCPNYGQVWSCPPYDFDVESYWRKFETLKLYAAKIVFPEELTSRNWEQSELNTFISQILSCEKEKLTDELMEMEKKYPDSISLSAGSCRSCNACLRTLHKPCCHPETMRYSIESLGGNVGHTIRKLMGLNLEWMEEGRLPHHFVLVCGLLIP